MQHYRLVPLALLLGLGVSWSVRLLSIKATASGQPSGIDVAFAASWGIAALTTLLNAARSGRLPVGAPHLRFYALSGVIGFGLPFLLEILIAPHLPPVLFVVIATSVPLWALLFALAFRLERLTVARVSGILIGFVATLVVILSSAPETEGESIAIEPTWLLASFSIPALYASYMLYVAKIWPTDLDNLRSAQGQGLAAALCFTVIWLVTGSGMTGVLEVVRSPAFGLIILSEVLALLCLFQIARTIGGGYATQANYIAVISGTLIGIVLFDQPLVPTLAVGVALLLVGLRLTAPRPV
ncbi:DMT family transporter [Jiella mangrovi]|uniref:DMT family transporter n=1 Tax=Jiella mangrovi TaxID=2821407 RepID=A0ABS4BDX4_9HYPH|nr:DMT family transporter [Jiella mangrovi]MBP0614952.1 DMT family transporter [Jiella mangrovi]